MNKKQNSARQGPASQRRRPRLEVRNATSADAKDIAALSRKIYRNQPPLNEQRIRGQLNAFPEGQFVAEYHGEIVGYCATFMIGEAAFASSKNIS